MGRAVPIFSTSIKCCVQVDVPANHFGADTGALLLSEIMERSGMGAWMTEPPGDPRQSMQVGYPAGGPAAHEPSLAR